MGGIFSLGVSCFDYIPRLRSFRRCSILTLSVIKVGFVFCSWMQMSAFCSLDGCLFLLDLNYAAKQ